MKIRLNEEQIKYIICETSDIENENPESIAHGYLSDPRNEIVWRIFRKATTESIFEHGYTAEYFGNGEGSYHGPGLYSFYNIDGVYDRIKYQPQVAQEGYIGDTIMKCVILNGFKNFLILDAPVARKYYGSDDITVQLNKIYDDKNFINELTSYYAMTTHNGTKLYNERTTGFISKALWEHFGMKLRSGKCRGIVYNGANDHHACITFNPREIIPLAVTSNRQPFRNDFTDWKYLVSNKLIKHIKTFGDFHSIGEKLKQTGLIKNYVKQAPINGFLRVTLNNGMTSYYDTKHNKLVSSHGFNISFGFKKDNDGTLVMPAMIRLNGQEFEFILVASDGVYYVCRMVNEKYKPFKSENNKPITMDVLDAMCGTATLNEGILLERGYNRWTQNSIEPTNDKRKEMEFRTISNISTPVESIYHRTSSREACENISKYGFSPEYATTEAYGHGLYCATSANQSTEELSRYGDYMIHAYVKNGFKDFFICDLNLAAKYYGRECGYEEQFKKLCLPEFYEELRAKYLKNVLYSPYNILNIMHEDLGKTKIRGLIHSNIPHCVGVICDWKCAIPFEYSNDNGVTWNMTLNDKNFKHIDEHRDALHLIMPFVEKGIVKNTFKKNSGNGEWTTDLNAHPQFTNGFLRVTLTNGKISFYSYEDNNLISYTGFDRAINWQKDSDGELSLDCSIGDVDVKIFKYNGEYIMAFPGRSKKTGEIVYKPIKTEDGQIMTTKFYDKLYGKK